VNGMDEGMRKEPGGAEKATYEIARRWVLSGHKVHWICGGFSRGRKVENIDGITVTRVGGKYSVYGLLPLYYLAKLRRSSDVVIDEINTVPFFSVLFAKEPKVALIHQLAADVLFEELPWIQAKFWSLMEPRVLSLYKGLPIISSESTKDDLARIGLPRSNIHTINYGVDKLLYKPGEKSPTPLVIYLGRVRRFKGVHYLIRAMRRIVQDVPGTKASIVGKGEPTYELELRQLVVGLKLTKDVGFHEFGFRDSSMQKIKLLQKAWVLVFPSIREGFGLTVVEANACGTPAVVTNVPGLRSTVKNNETGLLVPPRDVDALAEAVIMLLKDETLRARLSTSALQWSRNFDWDRTADQTLSILRSAIDSQGSRQVS